MEQFLKDIIKTLGERGYLHLCVDKTMPSDCFYYYVVKPTVIICAKLMEIDASCYKEVILKAIKALLERRFVGHGYETEAEQTENLAYLLENGMLNYIAKDQFDINTEIVEKKQAEWEENRTYYGFGDWTVETAHLLGVWRKLTRVKR